MDTAELKNLWKSHDNILERSVKLNILCVEKLQSQKAKAKIKPLMILRIIESMILAMIILFLFSNFIDGSASTGILISAAILITFSLYALYLCALQIMTIIKISYSDSVTDIQKKLALLQTHILDYFRLTFLMIPFWLVYPVIGFKIITGADITQNLPAGWVIAQLILLPLCIYLYRQISYLNIDKSWVKFLINNAGGKSAAKASGFLNEIYEFEKI